MLRGADGVVFVADSQREKLDENVESLRNLHENLLEQDCDVRDFPMVMQYNKRDLPGVLPVETLSGTLNFRTAPEHAATALTGDGVFDTLRAISERVLQRLSREFRGGVKAGT